MGAVRIISSLQELSDLNYQFDNFGNFTIIGSQQIGETYSTNLNQGYLILGPTMDGLYRQGTGSLSFPNSNLGIKTITPVSTLDVAGGVSIGSYAGSIGAPSNGLIISGNVGIKTSSPTVALDVNGVVKATSFNGDGSALTGISGTAGGIGGSGTINTLSKFTASGAIGNCRITDDGTDINILGATTTYGASLTSGALLKGKVPASGFTGDLIKITDDAGSPVTKFRVTSGGVIITGTGPTTLTDAVGKILVASIAITGTPNGLKFLRDDGSWQLIPGGGDAFVANPLSQFATTTSAQLAGVISNETGSGLLVFNDSPTLLTPALGTPTALVLTSATGLPPTTGIVGWPANASGVLTNNGSGVLSWAAGGGSQTPWTSAIDGDGFVLSDVGDLIPRAGSSLGSAALPWLSTFTGNTTQYESVVQTAGLITHAALGSATNISIAFVPKGAAYIGIGGSTASFPGLFRSGTKLGVVLADGSAYTTVSAADFQLQGVGGPFLGVVTDVSILNSGQTLYMPLRVGNIKLMGLASTTLDLMIERNAAGVAAVSNGTTGQWGSLLVGTRDASTNVVSNGLTIGHQSTGTPAAGLGSGVLFNINSSTTPDRNAGQHAVLWTDATDATRTADHVFYNVLSGAALAETFRIKASGAVIATGLITTGSGITSTGTFDLTPTNSSFAVRVGTNGFYPTTTNTVDLGFAGGGFSWKSLQLVGRIGWDNAGTIDTAFSRISAGLIGVGTGAAGSFAGGLKMALTETGTATEYESVVSSAGLITHSALGSATNIGYSFVTKGTGSVLIAPGNATAGATAPLLFGLGGQAWSNSTTAAGIGTVIAGGTFYLTAAGLTPVTFTLNSTSPRMVLNDVGMSRSAAAVLEIINGTAGQWGSLLVGTRDASTNVVSNGLTIGHQSTGTPAAGLGSGVLFNINSSTTADQNAGQHAVLWTDATHATRTADHVFYNVLSGAALAETFRIKASGAIHLKDSGQINAPSGGIVINSTIRVGQTVGEITAETATSDLVLKHVALQNDLVTKSLNIIGQQARTVATTNLVGGNVTIIGGMGASSSAGLATGGNVLLDGGQGFGTGAAGDIKLASVRGNVIIGGGTTSVEFRILEPSGSGSNYTAFKTVAQSANITYSLPATVGAAGTYLRDVAGDGVLSWATVAGGGATAALDNLAVVNINTDLLFQATAGVGSATKPALVGFFGNTTQYESITQSAGQIFHTLAGSATNISEIITLKGTGTFLITNATVSSQFGPTTGGVVSVGSITNSPVGIYTNNGNYALYVLADGNSVQVRSGAQFGFTSSTDAGGTLDVILTRAAAANLQLGAPAADTNALIVAQKLSVQNLLASGTPNQAGKDFIIAGSQGKGTGVGGSIIFQTAPAGSTGTTVNSLVTALTLAGSGAAAFVGNVTASGVLIAGTGPTTLTNAAGQILGTSIAITGTPTGAKFLRDDFSWQTIAGGGDALVANSLSQFAATTSAQLAGVLSDETGFSSGALAVFSKSPTIETPTIASFANANHNHTNSAGGGTLSGSAIASGTVADARLSANIPRLDGSNTWSGGGPQVFNEAIDVVGGEVYIRNDNLVVTSTQQLHLVNTTAATGAVPTQVSPSMHFAGHQWDGSSDLNINFRNYLQPFYSGSRGAALLWEADTTSGSNYGASYVQILKLDSNGRLELGTPGSGGVGMVFTPLSMTFEGNDVSPRDVDWRQTIDLSGDSESLTLWKLQLQYNEGGFVDKLAVSGMGDVIVPGQIIAGSSSITVTNAAGKVLVSSIAITGTPNGLKFLRDDGSWQTTGNALTTNPLSQFAATTSAQLAGVLSDETGFSSGALAVFSKSPTIETPTIASFANANHNHTNSAGGGQLTPAALSSFVGLPVEIGIAVGDEVTAITTGTAKVTFRMPYAMTVTAVRASVNTVSSSGLPTVDINEGGTTILSTKLSIDASEFTSLTAATPAVISDSGLANDAEITIDIDVAGTGAKGLKVWIIGVRA